MKRSATLFFIPAFFASSLALANPPTPNVFDGGNRWTITAFNDASMLHSQMATQGICFSAPVMVGTHLRGYWYSDTFPDWNGVYSQEGDQVFLHGDYAKDVGHDAMQLSLTSSREGDGHWVEWRENGGFGKTIVFANAKVVRVDKCRSLTEDELSTFSVAPRYLEDGRAAENPLDENQVPLKQ